jgi:glycosyltransferase involved in cell wall biosynthesis
VLEALACGVPVVVPAHGAFPEMISRTRGGRLFTPGDTADLARVLGDLLADRSLRESLGQTGQQQVHEQHSAAAMARSITQVMRQFVPQIAAAES